MRTDTVNKKINRGSVPLRENVKQIVAVLDFGGQYSHLIVRRCRESKVYAELFPHDITVERLKAVSPSAIVLSGGPASVYAENSPMCDTGIFALGVPVLGICYGAQLIAQMKGGRVEKARRAEYGKMELFVENDSDLFKGISSPTTVWMSHGDRVESLPANFEVLAHTENAPIAAFRSGNIYGIQFHLEVVHTVRGKEILENFLYRICRLNANWTPDSFAESAVREIKEKIASGKVICALSGGIDSSVVALLTHRAVGDRLTCIFVDHGFMRKGEAEEVGKTFRESFRINLISVDARERFMRKLRGASDPEQKRRIIGEEFVRVFEEEAKKIRGVKFLAQGTIYPDRIESAAVGSKASRIKTHHNVGGLPDKMNLQLIEPIRDLYKDEVRAVARELKLPDRTITRHPFPGPGLATRVIGEVTEEKLRICRDASAIVEEELQRSGHYDKVWQAFAVVGDDLATGVLGDERSLGHIVTVRVVESREAMTADYAKLPWDVLEAISKRITNEVRGVTWVAYAVSSKPPSTIEPC
jgi:GMP synthase (glutamine-hydrolysing)